MTTLPHFGGLGKYLSSLHTHNFQGQTVHLREGKSVGTMKKSGAWSLVSYSVLEIVMNDVRKYHYFPAQWQQTYLGPVSFRSFSRIGPGSMSVDSSMA